MPSSMISQADKLPASKLWQSGCAAKHAVLYGYQKLITQATLHHHGAVFAPVDTYYREMPCTMSTSATISESAKLL